MSWTPNLPLALTYSPGGRAGEYQPDAHLFTVVAPPDRILAMFNDEWGTDVRGLPIEVHGPVRNHSPRIVRLGDMVEKFPHLQYALDHYGPDYPLRMLPEHAHAIPADDEITNAHAP